MRPMTFLGELLQDVRYAARVVARQPGTTFIIVLSLALGIGANTLVFSLVNAILLRSLPYPEPDRLVQMWPTPPERPNQRSRFNATICMDLPTKDSFFTAAGCYIGVAGNVADPEDALTTGPEWLEGEMLTYHAVQALGVKPVVGRWFTQAEDHGDAEKVMLISYDLWQRRFNGTPDILGKRLRVADFGGNDTPSTIIGVMPPGFSFANSPSDYFVPLRATGRGRRSPARNRDVVARLKDGVTLEQAQAAADQLARDFGEESPQNKGWGIRVVPLDESMVGGNLRSAFQILQGTAAPRAADRVRERRRPAAGAGRDAAARAGRARRHRLRTLAHRPSTADRESRARVARCRRLPDRRRAGHERAVEMAAAVAAAAERRVAEPDGPGLHRRRVAVDVGRLRHAAGMARIAAGSVHGIQSRGPLSHRLVRQAAAAQRVRRAADLDGARAADRCGAAHQHADAADQRRYRDRSEESHDARDGFHRSRFLQRDRQRHADRLARIRTEPAHQHRRQSDPRPDRRVAGRRRRDDDASEHAARRLGRLSVHHRWTRAANSEKDMPGARWLPIGADYFKVLRVPVVRGREFTDLDTLSTTPVALINETMAKQFWPNEDPIGQTISIQFYNDQPRQIVGIVPDIRPNLRNRDPEPQMYVPHTQLPTIQAGITAFGLESVTFVVRSSRAPRRTGCPARGPPPRRSTRRMRSTPSGWSPSSRRSRHRGSASTSSCLASSAASRCSSPSSASTA